MLATIAAKDYHLEIEEYNPLCSIKSSSTSSTISQQPLRSIVPFASTTLTSPLPTQITTSNAITSTGTSSNIKNTDIGCNTLSQSISISSAEQIENTTTSECHRDDKTKNEIKMADGTNTQNSIKSSVSSDEKAQFIVSSDTFKGRTQPEMNPVTCTPSTSMRTCTSCETTTSNVCKKQKSSTSSCNSPTNKKILVLDIDECIIHSEFLSSSSPSLGDYYRPVCHPAASTSSSSSLSSILHYEDSFVIHMNDGESAIINKRPGLDEFLKKANRHYEIYAYTASLAMYSEPIISYLDPHRQIFKKIYYRDSCILSKTGDYFLKDLKIISNDLSNIILVDNNPMSFLLQPYNGIPVPSFYNNAKDHTLYALWKILDHIKDVKDVRPKLDQMFHLKDVLFHFRYHNPKCI